VASPPRSRRSCLALAIMRRPILLAFLFSATAFVLLALADIAVWGGYQGMHAREQVAAALLTHAGMLAAVFLLSLVGSALAYLALGKRLPSRKGAVIGGAVFAVASFVGLVAAFGVGGLLVVAAWVLLGSALVATGSCLASKQHAG
jgi:hypothetical protein